MGFVTDGAEDELLWDTDDDAEIDSPGTEWDSYDKLLNNEGEDALELFDYVDEGEDFAGF